MTEQKHDSVKKVEDVSRDKSKVSDEDLKLDALGNEINLFECFWNNVGCDNSVERVKSVKKKTVNVVNADRDKEGKTEISELKVENLPKSLNKEEVENDGVQALKYHQKSADEKNFSKNSSTSVAAEISNMDMDEKEILEKNLEYIEGEEPKLDENYRLVIDQEKIIDKSLADLNKLVNTESDDSIGFKWYLHVDEVVENEEEEVSQRREIVSGTNKDMNNTNKCAEVINNDRKVKCKKNDYIDGRRKTKIDKTIKNNERSLKKKKEYRKGECLLEIQIRSVFEHGRMLL
ncbi:11188_t:CDS:2 [Dentiscutata erythropus]|uniref:11188_t:CDS:1 n=1 Tax=Dentiscutata erythropus TaxID=1348616 RepID=A0A9N9BC12_9GLOM|nr:11188_t:CDS:2 [Dentiscutata erythropus]